VPDTEIICQWCDQPFIYSEAEQARDQQSGFPPPRACAACLQQRRAADAAKRAARRPRQRRYRR
jgi:hypothetical protein